MGWEMSKPSALQRLKAAYKFFQRGWSGVMQPQVKKFPYSFPTWRAGNPEWQLMDYQTYAQEAFAENAIVYGAMRYWYDSVRAVPLRAYRGSLEEPKLLPMSHELSKLCLRPNRWQAWPEFQGLAQIYLKLAGNSYIYIDRKPGEDVPVALYTLRPDRVFIVPTNNAKDPIGYIYVPEGRATQDGMPILAKNMIHRKEPNPLDTLEGLGYGLSAISPGARSIDVDNAVTKYLKMFFEKGAMPPGMVSFDVPMMPEDMVAARQRLMEMYGGSENWSEWVIFDQGGKYSRLGLTFDELGMAELDGRNWTAASTVLGVPLTLIVSRPELVSSTYDNKSSDRKMFWQDKVFPEMGGWEREFQYYLSTEREFVKFDFSKVPALTLTPQEAMLTAKDALVGGAITVNEYRAMIKQDPADDGDVYLIPSSVVVTPYKTKAELEAEKLEEEMEPDPVIPPPQPAQPETQTPATTPGNEAMPNAEEEEQEAGAKSVDKLLDEGRSPWYPYHKLDSKLQTMTMEHKDAFWLKSDELAASYDDEYAKAATEALRKDERKLLSLLTEGKSKKATYDWDKYRKAVEEYLQEGGGADTNWSETFSAAQVGLMSAKVKQLNTEFSKVYPAAELLSRNWFNSYMIHFAQPINDTTNEGVKRLIEQAQKDGWSVPTMQKHLETMFEQWITGALTPDEFLWYDDRMPAYRRENISRTETIKASAVVSNALYEAWGSNGREWLATRDARTRDTHRAADGQVRAFGKKFDVGGYAMEYPGDMSAPANLTVNCRCTVIPILE